MDQATVKYDTKCRVDKRKVERVQELLVPLFQLPTCHPQWRNALRWPEEHSWMARGKLLCTWLFSVQASIPKSPLWFIIPSP